MNRLPKWRIYWRSTQIPQLFQLQVMKGLFKGKGKWEGSPLFMERTNSSLGKQIERVAIEYNQMQHLVKRGKHLPFMAENEWVTLIYTRLAMIFTHPCHSVLHGSRTLCRASYQGHWNLRCDNCRRVNPMIPQSNL